MIASVQTIITDQIVLFVFAGLAILAAVAGVAVGILIYKWGMRKLWAASGYDYMDSYKNANFGEVENAIYRSRGNNTAEY